MSDVMAEARRVPRRLADLALLAVAAAWGLTFPLGKIVLSTLPPFTYIAVRFGLAAAILLFAAYALQTLGLRLTTSNAGFITGLSVAMVPVISAVRVRRMPHPAVLAGWLRRRSGWGC